MSKLEQGQVTIKLTARDGSETTYTLNPSLAAFTTLPRIHGGFGGLIDKLLARDPDAFLSVIRYGAGLRDADMKGANKKLFENGITPDLFEQLVKFVGMLQNGGKPVVEEEGDGAGEAGAQAPAGS